MSREKPAKRRGQWSPRATDWLYACPPHARTHAVVAALCAAHPEACGEGSGPEVTEVVARGWDQSRRMTNDLLDAFGYQIERKTADVSPGESSASVSVGDTCSLPSGRRNCMPVERP